MNVFTQGITVLQTLVTALGAGVCVWGGINLLEAKAELQGDERPELKNYLDGIDQHDTIEGLSVPGTQVKESKARIQDWAKAQV